MTSQATRPRTRERRISECDTGSQPPSRESGKCTAHCSHVYRAVYKVAVPGFDLRDRGAWSFLACFGPISIKISLKIENIYRFGVKIIVPRSLRGWRAGCKPPLDPLVANS